MLYIQIYLIMCACIALMMGGSALWEDIKRFHIDKSFDPKKNNAEYAKWNPGEYVIPNYKNPIAYASIFLFSCPVVNLIFVTVLIFVSIALLISIYDSLYSKPK